MKVSPQLGKWAAVIAFLLVIVALISYVFYQNPESAILRFGKESQWQAPMALVVIVVFLSGFLIASLIGFFLLAKQKLIGWFQWKSYQAKQARDQLILEGREYRAAGDFPRAKANFQRVINADSSNILARILLAETERDLGNYRQALAILDEARQSQQNNVELLFLAAELNQQIANHTAAYDNLSLVIKARPKSKPALRALVNAARKLQRFDDALRYQDALIRISPTADTEALTDEKAFLEIESLVAQNLDPSTYRTRLLELTKRYKNFAPLLAEIGKLDGLADNVESATKLLLKAYKQSGSFDYLQQLATLWLGRNDPGKAIAAIRNAIITQGQNERSGITGTIFLASVLIELSMFDDALAELTKLMELKSLTSTDRLHVTILIASIAHRRNDHAKAYSLLLDGIKNSELLFSPPYYQGIKQ